MDTGAGSSQSQRKQTAFTKVGPSSRASFTSGVAGTACEHIEIESRLASGAAIHIASAAYTVASDATSHVAVFHEAVSTHLAAAFGLKDRSDAPLDILLGEAQLSDAVDVQGDLFPVLLDVSGPSYYIGSVELIDGE